MRLFLGRCAYAASAVNFVVPFATPQAGAQSPVPVYHLSVRVRPDSSSLAVGGTVRLPGADSDRHELRLQMRAAFANATFELVSPSVRLDGPIRRDTSDDNAVWTLHTDKAIPAHRPVTVRFEYSGNLSATQGLHIGLDGSFVELGWYPEEAAQHARDSRAAGSLRLEVPAGYTVAASGERRSSDSSAREGQFEFVTKVPRRLAFAVGRYSVAHARSVVPVSLYSLKDRPESELYAKQIAHFAELLSREFGPFPYASLSVVEVPTGPARHSGFGGRSANGIVFVTSDNIDRGFNTAFISHEISHQWWGDMLEPHGSQGEIFMLSEAMATYGGLRVVTALEGQGAAEQFRRIGYPGNNDSNLSYYLSFAVTGLDTVPLTKLQRVVLAHDLAATKGFRVWDMLSREVGERRFRRMLTEFARAHAFTTFTWSDLTRAMSAAAGQDLGWFFREWATDRTGAAEWTSTWMQVGDAVVVHLTQLQEPYRARLEIRLSGDAPNDTVSHTVTLSAKVATFSWRTPFRVRGVDVDPHFLVLHWPRELADELRASAPAQRGAWLDQLGYPKLALAQYAAALDSVPTPDIWGLRYQLNYSVAWLHVRDNQWGDAERHMRAALSLAGTSGASALACRAPGGSCAAQWGYYVIATAARALGDSTGLCRAVNDAIAADTGGRWGAGQATQAIAPGCGRPR
jgi:hypothetical protein